MIAHSLKADIETYAERLRRTHPLLQLAREGRLSPQTVTTYVANTRYLVSHTPRHMGIARRRALELGCPELAQHFEHKEAEERGHDKWAEEDIVKMGALFGTRDSAEPTRALAELVAYLDQAIIDEPVRYLAYALHIEYFTVLMGPEWVQALEEHCGVPREAMTMITRHVAADQGHVADALREIDVLVTNSALYPAMKETLFRAMDYVERFCDEIYQLAVGEAAPYQAAS